MKYLYILLLSLLLTNCSTPYSTLKGHLKASKQAPDQYLFVLDGILLDDTTKSKLYDLDKSTISVVEKVSDVAAKTIYGENAKPQTIIINTKKIGTSD